MAVKDFPALLLVDGYNIIGCWASLKKTRDDNGLESARRELVESLINYTFHKGYKTQIVFDSQYQKTPSSLEHHTEKLSVFFTAFEQTADTYIEKICADFSRKPTSSTPRIIVATSDQPQKLTVIGYGAEWISAERLATEVSCSHQQLKTRRTSGKKRFLMNCIDPNTRKLLSQWRQGQN